MNLIKKNIFIATTMALFFCCNMAVAMKQEEKQFNEVEQPEKIFEGHNGAISDMLLVDNILVSSSYDGGVKIWNVITGKCLKTLINCIDKQKISVSLNRIDLAYLGKKTVAICSNEKITLLNLTTGKCSNIPNISNIETPCFVHSNKSVFCFGKSSLRSASFNDGNIEFMNIETQKKSDKPIAVPFGIADMFSPGDNFLIVMGMSLDPNSLSVRIKSKLLDATTGKCLCAFSDNEIGIRFAVDIGNNIFAFGIGGPNNDIILWDIKTDKIINKLKGHKSPITALAYLGDNILVSGSYDSSIKFWDIQSGICLKEFINVATDIKKPPFSLTKFFGNMLINTDSPTAVFKLIFSPDKKILFAGLSDGRIIKLRIPTTFWPKEQFSKKLFGELKNKNPKPDIFFKFEEQI